MLLEEARILLQNQSFKQVFSIKEDFDKNILNKNKLNDLYYTFGKIFYFDNKKLFGYFLNEDEFDMDQMFYVIKKIVEKVISKFKYNIVLIPSYNSYNGSIYQYFYKNIKIAEINLLETDNLLVLFRKYSFFLNNVDFFKKYLNDKLLMNIGFKNMNKIYGMELFISHIIEEINKSLIFIDKGVWDISFFNKNEKTIMKNIRRAFLPSTYFSLSYLSRCEEYEIILEKNKDYFGIEEFNRIKYDKEKDSSYFFILSTTS